MTVHWTLEAVRSLGVVTDLETAGSIFGIGRTKSYELARAGDFPVPLMRLGTAYRAPVAPILTALGITPDMGTGPVATSPEPDAHDETGPRRDATRMHVAG